MGIAARSVLKDAAMLLAAVLLTAASAVDTPEPAGIWMGPMHGHTPKTLSGAVVFDAAALDAMMPGHPLLLDVGPGDRKPPDFPKELPWLPTHLSIPGAVWLPGAGAAPLDAAREALFYERVRELTNGDKSKMIVTFCHPECWGSWNAAKRLVLEGYTGVHWYPDGIEGWQDDHETLAVAPDPVWEPKTASEGEP